MDTTIQAQTIEASRSKVQRLVSLDAFRGFTIAAMIIVNDPGSWSHVYAPLLHAEWHGITPTDLVFPFFLFIVGVSIVLAYTKRMEKAYSTKDLVQKVLIRALKIFVLGLFLNLYPKFNFEEIRIPGVLQRISIVFICCALLFLFSGWKQWLKACLALLVLYCLAMMLIPVPGLGAGVLEPGKNLAAWVDSLLIPGRLWQGTWDPEGLLSTFPAIATGITGMLAGRIIVSSQEQHQKVVWLFVWGFALFVLGGIWNWFFPINKNLWTSSYVLYTSGLAFLCLAASIFIVDIKGYKKWTRIGVIFGANAITAYVLAGILGFLFVFELNEAGDSLQTLYFNGLVNAGMAPKLVSLIWAVLYTALCFVPVYILYKKKIFIKV
ncbi:heparan-alpha-glucosaminide N-acetyltransferase domain-containing protein [Rapidithrix thailandica]|uniref:Heparan-alpha-glucosaminide N-acetyltransferase domain-containing protein n=1 Tax=Rapidithrix thailandica TaxID=413964 RepID=A0AAW9SA07_9BACT